jgi:hypothetical protein
VLPQGGAALADEPLIATAYSVEPVNGASVLAASALRCCGGDRRVRFAAVGSAYMKVGLPGPGTSRKHLR